MGGTTFGQRLKLAIDRWGTIRRFHRELEEGHKGVVGVSYPSVHRYLKGRTEPTAGFIEAAAKVLGVREEWLASGQEPMIDARPKKARGGMRLVPWADFQEQLPVSLEPAWRDLAEVLWQRHGEAQRLGLVEPMGTSMGVIGNAIAAPLKALGVDPAKIPRSEMRDYVVEMSIALRRLVVSLLPPPEERYAKLDAMETADA